MPSGTCHSRACLPLIITEKDMIYHMRILRLLRLHLRTLPLPLVMNTAMRMRLPCASHALMLRILLLLV